MKKELVSSEWLKHNSSNENLVILDASPKRTVSGKSSALNDLCIPQARLFNIKQDFTDKNSELPNTVPSASQFEQAAQALGINTNSEIVVYDNLGVYTSPRVWWLFKLMGHEHVCVLDGGLVDWVESGYETVPKADLKDDFIVGDFKSKLEEEYIVKYEEVLENMETKKLQIVDARSKGRFEGTEKDPRKHLQSGHIPNSINIPYKSLLENGKFKSKEELNKIFTENVTTPRDLAFSCGSGMTACIVMLASEIAFQKSRYLFDGSWTEYAEKQNLTNH